MSPSKCTMRESEKQADGPSATMAEMRQEKPSWLGVMMAMKADKWALP